MTVPDHNDTANGFAAKNGKSIQIRGARVHNLQDINIDIPCDRLVVITGVSGSGKSSLAFDTLYAEGKRQYIESLSVYARQFLDQLTRPDVDLIDGLQPTLCIDQRSGSQNPRSTVATVTEIYDFLRLLMARLGEPTCYQCGAAIRQQSIDQIQDRVLKMPEGTKTMILAPLVRGRKGAHREVIESVRRAGFVRVRVDGLVCELDDIPPLVPQKSHHIDAVVDRIIIRKGIESRLAESVRLAVQHGDGLMAICYHEGTNKDAKSSDDNGDASNWRDELFSTKYACPDCDVSYEELEPRTFSFNSPYGACPVCEGLGSCDEFDPELVIPNAHLSLNESAIAPWKSLTSAARQKWLNELQSFVSAQQIDFDTPLDELPNVAFSELLYGDDKKFLGILLMLEKEYATATRRARLAQLQQYRGKVRCKSCCGSRLRREATSVRFQKRAIHDITGLSVSDAREFFTSLQLAGHEQPVGEPLVREILRRLEFLDKVGIGYLSLDRATDTLSGGEFQRVRLGTSIGSGLVGVCYILDEPSIGLHPRDNARLIASLRELQQQGNTVLVVEHDETVMRESDWLIDMGPGAGAAGGSIVTAGTPDEVRADTNSLTGRYLANERTIHVPAKRRRTAKSRSLVILGANTHNLRDIDVTIPLGVFVCVTGVSGSGKSSLVNETLAPALLRRLGQTAQKPGEFKGLRGASQVNKVITIDQNAIGRTPRSNPATYTGVFDEIRKVFAGTRQAKQYGFRAGRFSFNNKGGRCEACQGQGLRKIEMSFLPDLYVTCDQCNGARFNAQTLQVRYRDRSIADVLEMSVDEACTFFENFSHIHRALISLQRVGLGYLPLGQPSSTLSGGEAQRIKLATELSRTETGKTLYLLDEPTTGLHFDDIRRLLDVLQQLVDNGNTVLVVEHNLEVVKCADWIVDLGPAGGEDGGQLVATGTPETVAEVKTSHTGNYLRELLTR